MKWTDEQVRLLIELKNKGMKYKEIAPLVGHSLGSTKKKSLSCYEQFERKPWSTKEIELLKDMNKKGLSSNYIADVLERSRSSVYQKLYTIGEINVNKNTIRRRVLDAYDSNLTLDELTSKVDGVTKKQVLNVICELRINTKRKPKKHEIIECLKEYGEIKHTWQTKEIAEKFDVGMPYIYHLRKEIKDGKYN